MAASVRKHVCIELGLAGISSDRSLYWGSMLPM